MWDTLVIFGSRFCVCVCAHMWHVCLRIKVCVTSWVCAKECAYVHVGGVCSQVSALETGHSRTLSHASNTITFHDERN